jgi:dihydroneopterin aldolase
MHDCVIIGAGPAGCSAASWAAQMGLSVAVVDRATAPCGSLAALQFPQDWVLGFPDMPLAAVGMALAEHARRRAGVSWQLGAAVKKLARLDDGWRVEGEDVRALDGRALVLATGVRPVRPVEYFGTDRSRADVLDAVSLTARRSGLPPGRVLLLGGGDNALENAAYLAARGHTVTVWTRGGWRGRAALVDALDRNRPITQRRGTPLPTALRAAPGGGIDAESAAHGVEHFDHAAVLFGTEPEPAPWSWLREALGSRAPAEHPTPGQAIERLGVFVAGDASGRGHPCVQTALADGVRACHQVMRFLGHAGAADPVSAIDRVATLNSQVLQLSGLRFAARLGVLPQERDAPQPIQVDAELNLGRQLALAGDAQLRHVLDYRKVRRLIIDECNAEHTDLLESLLAKLCRRLMQLPGVLGVRIRLAKLAIFDDCEVAIRCEAGIW